MRQGKPLSALASAFDMYCELVLSTKGTGWSRGIVHKLHASLGRDACNLIKIIPKLGLVLDEVASAVDPYIDQNSTNAMRRLHI